MVATVRLRLTLRWIKTTILSICALAALAVIFGSEHKVAAREWSDSEGQYTIDAELFGFNDDTVVLQRDDKELGRIDREDLSAEDREYLQSKEALDINNANLNTVQTWTTARGSKLVGRIVDYAQKEITIQRRRGRTYVNDRRLSNLPEQYRLLLPEIVEHFDEVAIPNERAMQSWLRSLRGQPRTFSLEGVILEGEDGDEYLIPFFVFSDDDRRLLKAEWTDWLAFQHDYDQRNTFAFALESFAAAHFENQEYKKRIALMNLDLQAIRAGLTSAWEVTLYPELGNPRPPMWVVMPGRDSAQATQAALLQHPGFVAGSVRRVSRR